MVMVVVVSDPVVRQERSTIEEEGPEPEPDIEVEGDEGVYLGKEALGTMAACTALALAILLLRRLVCSCEK